MINFSKGSRTHNKGRYNDDFGLDSSLATNNTITLNTGFPFAQVGADWSFSGWYSHKIDTGNPALITNRQNGGAFNGWTLRLETFSDYKVFTFYTDTVSGNTSYPFPRAYVEKFSLCHYVFNYDSATREMSLFVNSTLIGKLTIGVEEFQNPSNDCLLFAFWGGAIQSKGVHRDFCIFDKKLTELEINEIYRTGVLPQTTHANCQFHMPFNDIPKKIIINEVFLFTDINNSTTITANITQGVNSGYEYNNNKIVSGDVLNQTISIANGTVQSLVYYSEEIDNVTFLEANGNEWVSSVDFSELSNIQDISFQETRQTSITFPTNNTNPITNLNLTRSDFAIVDLTNVNIGGDLQLGAITQVSPIEPLNSLTLPLNNNNVWTFFQIINSSITSLDLSQQNKLGGSLRLLTNTLLTSLTLGSSNETFTTISIFGNSGLTSGLDLSGYPNILNIDVKDNSLPSVTFPNATSLINGINGDNNNITSLDFTPLGNNFSGVIRFENNNINSLTFPANSQAITRLDFTNNNLSTIDLSGLSGLSGIIHFNSNNFTSQSDFNFPTITNVLTNLRVDVNNISGIWDFTTFMNPNTISGSFDLSNNSITQIIYQSSNLNISSNKGANNNINTVLDLTPLPNSSGILDFQNNSIPSVILPNSSGVFTQLRFNNNNIVNFDITPLTGANNSINPLRLNNNDMTTSSMDALIVQLDNKGWTNGNLIINAQSTTQQPTTSAPAYISLQSKGWTITI